MEVIHVGLAVGIDPGQQWHHGRQVAEVVPVDGDPSSMGDRDQVQGVISRAAGGQQADDPVDDRPFVHHPPDRQVLVAQRGDPGRPLGRRWVSASRNGVLGWTNAAPGRCRPITSISI